MVLVLGKTSRPSDCERGDSIGRGEWSPDSQFFVFTVREYRWSSAGDLPVSSIAEAKQALRLENYIGYMLAQDFTLEART